MRIMSAEMFVNAAAKCLCAALAVTAGRWCGAAETSGFNWKIPKSCEKYVKIENDLLTVDVPHGVTNVCAYATAEIDLSDWMFSILEAEIMCRAERLERSPRPHRGLRLSLFYFDTDKEYGRMRYPRADAPEEGSFDWRKLKLSVLFGENPPGTDPKPRLVLGIQQTPGKAVFDLSTFRCERGRPHFPTEDNGYQVKYPERVRSRGRMRGVMSRGMCRNTERDIEDLKRYGANLLRLHMNGFGQYVKHHRLEGNLESWNAWLEENLDHAEQVLGWLEKRDMMMVLDQHSAPLRGIAGSTHGSTHEVKENADRFVSSWEEIARRFKGRRGLYGYDLFNEPAQYGRALPDCDYWNLQRRAAEAIRRIDPDATIIVAANEYSGTHAFRYLRALEMDNVIYQFHFYKPAKYTHQGVNGAPPPEKGSELAYPDVARGWTKDYLRECLRPVVEFQRRHGAKLFVGEFSASCYAPGAGQYISDCIDLFEEFDIDWTYHAFRQFNCWWDVESVPGEEKGTKVANVDNDRFRALIGGFGRKARAPLDFVDVLVGTEGTGSEYGGMMPATGVPFGSFNLVPMTRLNRVGQLSFNQADDTLIGFILTRQPAIWMGDWGEFRIPIEPAKIESYDYRPYYGRIAAGGRWAEYTATEHAAWLRGKLWKMRPMSGYSSNRDDENLGVPLKNFRGWRYVRQSGKGVQIGLSLVSLEQARRNLEREIGDKTFETVVAETKAKWEDYFSRVSIDASDDVKTIFYTGLYHTLLYPRQMDEEGRYYSAFDDQVHEGTRYNCYSLWDTYRAEHPWLTLVAPERVDGMMQSLVDMYKEGGWLPKWPNPGYTGIMIGAPAEVVLAEACAKGFRGFDLVRAYEAVRKNATVPQAGDEECDWRDRGEFGARPETRGGLTSYMKRGYVACDRTRESVSRTQDFGLADLAAAHLAEATGHAGEAAMFRRRAKSFTNLWNSAARCFLPRRADGTFKSPAELPGPRYEDYCEQSPHTGVWAVPFDTETLAGLMGGREAATRRLDDFFDNVFWVPERSNRSIHGNEPSHHCAYLYNRFGHPEKTQRRVHEILTRSYSTDRKGFDGNEDCGQMSAWYILSALGFYPLDPVSAEYELGSPIVRGATLKFGRPYAPATLKIVVKGRADGDWRVRRVLLNGRELTNWRVRHADLVRGGELVFEGF